MEVELEIVSRENIKPSRPTPSHLRIFKLSLLDQLIPSPYAPIILFYPANDNNISGHHDLIDEVPKRLESLKKSLSDTLTRFYPLAGKINDDLSIDCNDEGAYYVEARVDSSLRQFISQPHLLYLANKLLPCEFGLGKSNYAGTYVTNIQVNVFDCGGIAIGVCISHRILDGVALSTFLKAWAATARGCQEPIRPCFDAISLFPANDLWLRDTSTVMFGSFFTKGKSVTKRFLFDASAILTLKARATSSTVQNPTRVEAVSGFIWGCVMAASKGKNGVLTLRPYLMTHLVNLRRRTTPFLSEHSVGNLLWIVAAKSSEAKGEELRDLVSLVRDCLAKFDEDFVKRLRSDEGNCLMLKSLKEITEVASNDRADHIGFSSWCKFGFYEADFGWGKPIWVSSVGLSSSAFMNLVILVDTKFGHGIEAWVTLDKHHMAVLECNSELLKLAQVDPSPF